MKSEKMIAALNKQINAEMYSSYMYLSMAAYFESINLKGFAHWMQKQSNEETVHAMKFYKYINERMWRVQLTEIAAPVFEWKSPQDAFEAALAHEKKVTAMIYNLMDIAIETKDYATQSMLKWFIDEQVEEEANADEIVNKLKVVGDLSGAVMFLDHHLGKRE